MDLTDIELINLRKQLYEEVNRLPQCKDGWAPEIKDFEIVKTQILSVIAYKIWEKKGKPRSQDTNIWIQAEEVWNFIRHLW